MEEKFIIIKIEGEKISINSSSNISTTEKLGILSYAKENTLLEIYSKQKENESKKG